jgi:hypothetical protein
MSLTVLSTKTPPMRRKHLRSGSSAKAWSSVERTRLCREGLLRKIWLDVLWKRRTYVRLPLTRVHLFSLQELVVHFVIEYNFAGSLADLVQSEISRVNCEIHTLI